MGPVSSSSSSIGCLYHSSFVDFHISTKFSVHTRSDYQILITFLCFPQSENRKPKVTLECVFLTPVSFSYLLRDTTSWTDSDIVLLIIFGRVRVLENTHSPSPIDGDLQDPPRTDSISICSGRVVIPIPSLWFSLGVPGTYPFSVTNRRRLFPRLLVQNES